jgi:hypothetical protein
MEPANPFCAAPDTGTEWAGTRSEREPLHREQFTLQVLLGLTSTWTPVVQLTGAG